jgi:hypothetical protein
MNTSASAVSSVFWLPQPVTEAGEKQKKKPAQTEVETRLWKTCQQAANPKGGWIQPLVYTLFAGSSAASVAYAFQGLNALLANDGLSNAINKFFE